jgi:ApeA N-terminal domain 1
VQISIDGHFWVADVPDQQVRGHLTWDPVSGGSLVLEGFVGEPDTRELITLSGRALDGTPLVLLRCFVRHFGASDRIVQSWRVNEAFVGTDDGDPSITTLCIRLDGLRLFYPHSGLTVTGASTNNPREQVAVEWTPTQSVPTMQCGGAIFEIVDGRHLQLDEDEFSIRHDLHLRVSTSQPATWEKLAYQLGLVSVLIEFLADRPMQVQRQWRPGSGDDVDRLFWPLVGTPPEDDRVWLNHQDVVLRMENAVVGWHRLDAEPEGLVDLLAEEIRYRRRTSVPDRILRLARIVELLHRHRHPDAEPEDDDDVAKIERVLYAAPDKLRDWLRGRLGVSSIRLRQRIHELLGDLGGGLDSIVVDPKRFATIATKTRNWHTHYSDHKDVVEGEYAYYLAERLWLLVRASVLLELGWPPEEATMAANLDRKSAYIAQQPLGQ